MGKYSRLKPKAEEVTISLSWVGEPVTLRSVYSMPAAVMLAFRRNDEGPLLGELDPEFAEVMRDATLDEFGEFVEAWNEASEKQKQAAKFDTSVLNQVMSHIKSGGKK